MTVTHSATPSLEVDDLEQAYEEIRLRGLRLTSARRHLIAALFAAEGPATAEQIAAGLDGRIASADAGSVYRNLETLESIGLVRHIHLGHGPSLYALAGQIAPAYLLCDSCGAHRALSEDDLEPLKATIRQGSGYEASFAHFPIVGLCASCAKGAE